VVDGGTGIRFYHGALYASSPSRIYRIALPKNALIPKPGDEPQVVVDGMPAMNGSTNRQIAFDTKGNLYVAVSGSGNFCPDPATPKGVTPVGLKPCPDMGKRAGVWRFSATKLNQQFPVGGEQIATGLRDLSSLDWSPADNSLYLIAHGRDGVHQGWPAISQADDDAIADEMHKITKGTDIGWPYTYYDGVKKQRLVAPEYGGDGKTVQLRRAGSDIPEYPRRAGGPGVLYRQAVPGGVPERRLHYPPRCWWGAIAHGQEWL